MSLLKNIIEASLRNSKVERKSVLEDFEDINENIFEDAEFNRVTDDDIFDDEDADKTDTTFIGNDDIDLTDGTDLTGSDKDFGNVGFDEDGAKEEYGEEWFVALAEPIEKYLADSELPIVTDGEEDHLDKSVLSKALTDLFTHLQISEFSGDICADGAVITVKKFDVGVETDSDEDFLSPEENDYNKATAPFIEDSLGKTNTLKQTGEALDPEANSDEVVISELDLTWDGSTCVVNNVSTDYADDNDWLDSDDEDTDDEAEDTDDGLDDFSGDDAEEDKEDDKEEEDDDDEEDKELKESIASNIIVANDLMEKLIAEAESFNNGTDISTMTGSGLDKPTTPSMKDGDFMLDGDFTDDVPTPNKHKGKATVKDNGINGWIDNTEEKNLKLENEAFDLGAGSVSKEGDEVPVEKSANASGMPTDFGADEVGNDDMDILDNNKVKGVDFEEDGDFDAEGAALDIEK